MCKFLVEISLKNVKNKFELVLLLARKAQDISSGKIKLPETDLKYKATYLALREIQKHTQLHSGD